MNFDDLNNLELSDIGDWPNAAKALATLLLCVLLGVAWYYVFTQDQLVDLEKVEKQELVLKKEFEKKQKKRLI